MKPQVNGMVLLTTLCALSVVACMWLSLIHVVLLFRKVTHDLQVKHTNLKILEHDLQRFVAENDPERLTACTLHRCTMPSGVIFYVKKIVCDPCLSLDKRDEKVGSQHWEIRAEFQERRVVVRWATPAWCGDCLHSISFLNGPMLSWSLYPSTAVL